MMKIRELSDDQLWAKRREHQEALEIIDAELNRWENVECYICGAQDLAYRGVPCIIWRRIDGWYLCPSHAYRFDKKFAKTPADEIRNLL